MTKTKKRPKTIEQSLFERVDRLFSEWLIGWENGADFDTFCIFDISNSDDEFTKTYRVHHKNGSCFEVSKWIGVNEDIDKPLLSGIDEYHFKAVWCPDGYELTATNAIKMIR